MIIKEVGNTSHTRDLNKQETIMVVYIRRNQDYRIWKGQSVVRQNLTPEYGWVLSEQRMKTLNLGKSINEMMPDKLN